jgi:AraC-like DNA-binding protein
LLEGRGALTLLRRALPRGAARVLACRTPDQLRAALQRRLADAVVVSPRALSLPVLERLAADHPSVPVVALAPFRADDGELLAACAGQLRLPVLVEGVDDAALAELLRRHGAAAERRRLLADAPRLLPLRTPLQRDVWERVLARAHAPLTTRELAESFGVSREHLSRQFALEAAPNLKRVIDLARVATAAHLLQSPAYAPATVAQLLGYASASHLGQSARRVAGVGVRQLGPLGPRGVLVAFTRGRRTRSRL